MAVRVVLLTLLAGIPLAHSLHSSAVTMTATPGEATTSPTLFTITWSGVSNPQSTDWVAQYCAGASNPYNSNFGPWAYVDVCDNWVSGSCSMTLTVADPLVQAPCDSIVFAMYRDPAPYTFLGQSNAVVWKPVPNSTLRHERLAYGTDPSTQIHFSFTTADGTAPALVQLGTAPGTYSRNVSAAEAVTYTASDSCGKPSAWSFPGYFHHAAISGLSPATRYYARAVQGSAVGAETSFMTGKVPSALSSIRALVFADMSISNGDGAVKTAARIAERAGNSADPIDFALHVGDLSYGEGNVAVWEEWMDLIAPTCRAIPYHVSIGNHEYEYSGGDGSKDPSGAGKQWSPPFWNGGDDSGGECGMPPTRRFRMPENGNGVFWYSFSVGPVHVVMLSSEHNPSPGAPMGDWLAADLAAVNHTVTPWIILGIHRPLYETENYPSDYAVAQGLRKIMEPLLLKYEVDVVVAGHYHSFQRTCSVANLECVKSGGIVHYTTGAAGASLDQVSLIPSTYIENTILGTFGYSIMAANQTTLSLTFYRNDDDAVLDYVVLEK